MSQRKTGLSRDLYRRHYRPNQRLTSAFAGRLAKLNLVRSSKKILRQGGRAKDVCLWIGEKPGWYLQGFWAELYTLWHGRPPIIPIPIANLSIRVVGAARSGKTTSAINPAMLSAIKQRMPVVLYEYKADESGSGGQMDFLVPYALQHRYNPPYFFAPGREYSDIFNPVDLLRDYNDAATARTLAVTLIENTQGDSTSSDGFFGPASESLVEGLIRLAKFSRYPDMAMAYTFLKLPDFPKRIAAAIERQVLPNLLAVPFTQVFQVKDSERTVGSIVAGALNSLMGFMQRDLLLSMMGTSTIISDKLASGAVRPGEEYKALILGQGEMVVCQSDIFRQEAVNPLLASLVVMMTNLNCSEHRQDPYILCLDENSTLIMNQQANWPNLHRSKKLVVISGYQNAAQMREALNQDRFQYLESGMQIGFFFRPSHGDTAEELSRLFGERETVLETRTQSRSHGVGGGTSHSRSQQVQKERLIDASRINSFDNGECVYVHPQCGTDRDGYGMPFYMPLVPVGKGYFDREKQCQQLWKEKVLPRLIAKQQSLRGLKDFDPAAVREWMAARDLPERSPNDLKEAAKSRWIDEQLNLRWDEAERILPPATAAAAPAGSTGMSRGGESERRGRLVKDPFT